MRDTISLLLYEWNKWNLPYISITNKDIMHANTNTYVYIYTCLGRNTPSSWTHCSYWNGGMEAEVIGSSWELEEATS